MKKDFAQKENELSKAVQYCKNELHDKEVELHGKEAEFKRVL